MFWDRTTPPGPLALDFILDRGLVITGNPINRKSRNQAIVKRLPSPAPDQPLRADRAGCVDCRQINFKPDRQLMVKII